MAYNSYKDPGNPFLPVFLDKWSDLTRMDGDSVFENIIKTIINIIVLLIILALIPIGFLIAIYNSLYNLQAKTLEKIQNSNHSAASKFSMSVEFGIYLLLSIPLAIVLFPLWLIAQVFMWLVQHKVIAIVLIILAILGYIFRDFISDIAIPWIVSNLGIDNGNYNQI